MHTCMHARSRTFALIESRRTWCFLANSLSFGSKNASRDGCSFFPTFTRIACPANSRSLSNYIGRAQQQRTRSPEAKRKDKRRRCLLGIYLFFLLKRFKKWGISMYLLLSVCYSPEFPCFTSPTGLADTLCVINTPVRRRRPPARCGTCRTRTPSANPWTDQPPGSTSPPARST